jgi:hypothetical protein
MITFVLETGRRESIRTCVSQYPLWHTRDWKLTVRNQVLALLVTAQQHRQRGAGSMLVRWGIELSETTGLPCYVQASEQGRRLYQHHGFEEIGTVEFNLSEYGLHGIERMTEMTRGSWSEVPENPYWDSFKSLPRCFQAPIVTNGLSFGRILSKYFVDGIGNGLHRLEYRSLLKLTCKILGHLKDVRDSGEECESCYNEASTLCGLLSTLQLRARVERHLRIAMEIQYSNHRSDQHALSHRNYQGP